MVRGPHPSNLRLWLQFPNLNKVQSSRQRLLCQVVNEGNPLSLRGTLRKAETLLRRHLPKPRSGRERLQILVR